MCPRLDGTCMPTEVLTKLTGSLPFALLRIDTDYDTVFINETVKTRSCAGLFCDSLFGEFCLKCFLADESRARRAQPAKVGDEIPHRAFAMPRSPWAWPSLQVVVLIIEACGRPCGTDLPESGDVKTRLIDDAPPRR